MENNPLDINCEEWKEMAEENLQAMEVITAALAEVGVETCFSEGEESF